MVRPNTPEGLCIRCKGSRNLCGKNPCPILAQHAALQSIKLSDVLQKTSGRNVDIASFSPPAFFVGHHGYPAVNVGPMLPHSLDTPLEPRALDDPEHWLVPGSPPDTWKSLMDVVRFRSSLVRTTHRVSINNWQGNAILETSQQIAMAEKPVATETRLERVHARVQVDDHVAPSGPIGTIDKLRITENPRINPKVDYVVGDTDLKANEAVFKYLYCDGHLPVHDITRVLSAGLLGIDGKRKLVPTRWSITAVDDSVSKQLIDRIKFMPELGEHLLYETKFLGNSFHVILVPRPWLFEMMECWAPHSIWRMFDRDKSYVIVQDHEFSSGRTTYASNVTGAYYAARLGVAEHLVGMKRQAACIIVREVDSTYLMPLGVWVIRQAVRDALQREPSHHGSLAEVFKVLAPGLTVPMKHWLARSDVIPYLRTQRTLDSFVK